MFTGLLQASPESLLRFPRFPPAAAANPGYPLHRWSRSHWLVLRIDSGCCCSTAAGKPFASGLITLPDGMMEAEAAADPDDADVEGMEDGEDEA